MTHTVASLCAFSRRVAEAFEAKRISAPIHLCSDSQAQYLIDIFKDIRPDDWICCSWRSMFHCLLKGWPEDELFDAILDGRSMYLCSEKYKVVSSAIVGGVLPIAVGLAMGIKRKDSIDPPIDPTAYETVHCFVGDMTSFTGIYHETVQYARGQGLPLKIWIEDNEYSTNACTEKTWGHGGWLRIDRYHYVRDYPHTGIGKYVAF